MMRWLAATSLAMLGMLSVGFRGQPVHAAEAVRVSLGLLEFPLSLESLEVFARTGELRGDMRFYARFVNERSLIELREFLQQEFDLNPRQVSQVTYSPMIERSLQSLGRLILTEGRQNGFHALRAALLLSASDPEGMSVLSIIRNFPSRSIRIDAASVLELGGQFAVLTDYRNAAVAAIVEQMKTELAASPAPNFASLPDLQDPGSYRVRQETLELRRDRISVTGETIARPFRVNVYIPEGLSQPAPVVVISHGLGSSPEAFRYLGTHLASHGFGAVIPQHIGSDASRREDLIEGIVGSDVNPVEFIDRPLDIRFALNELERLSASNPALANRFNWQQVGVIGHSFGGYTALVLAGANPNIPRLQQECRDLPPTLNLAPILQCLGDRLPNFTYSLADPRVKAAIAISPIGSIILGPESMEDIQVPLFMIGGSNDFIASTIQEQVHPFFWLTTPARYLSIIIPSVHTYADDTRTIQNQAQDELGLLLAGPSPEVGREYLRELSLAFMQTHLAAREDYQPFLSAAYARFISRDPLQLTFVRSLTPQQVEQAFGGPAPVPVIPPLATTPVVQRSRPILDDIARTGILRIAVRRDAAPFGQIGSNGQPSGFCIDLTTELANQLTQQLKTPVRPEVVTISTLENRFTLVQQNTVHLECGPNTIQDGIPNITFSTPFFLTGTHFLIAAAQRDRINPRLNLSGVRIGVLPRTTTETFLSQRYPEATLVRFPGGLGRVQGVQALTTGNIDAFASDGILLQTEANLQNLSPTDYVLTPSGPLTCDPYGLILPADDRQWQDTVNRFIASDAFGQLWRDRFSSAERSYIFLNLDYCVR